MISSTRFMAIAAAVAGATAVASPAPAEAFCGFYVGGADTKLYNNATMVVMMRSGTRTVLSMANNYQGPPGKFAMVVPVPVVLKKSDVKTLSATLFDRVDKLAAPRLVEYWEQDPCRKGWGTIGSGRFGTIGRGSGTGLGFGAGARPRKVKVEAQFVVGEYEIVILSATEAVALEQWITGHGYTIPAGSAKYLAPYVKSGSKFFVAKVDPKKVRFKDGMAQLSPLRFSYDSKDFTLPIRLGLINANKAQDLIVHILAKNHRYEVANYPNVTIPTNLGVTNDVRKNFGGFYAALMDATLEKNKGAVVTEYAWDSATCDPCPGSPLRLSELKALGLDELDRSTKPGEKAIAGYPDMRLPRTTAAGKLGPMVLRRFLRRRRRRLLSCWEQSFRRTPRPPPRATLQFEIVAATGRATKVRVTGVADKKMTACLTGAVTSIAFPKGDAVVRQPLLFRLSPTRPGRSTRGWVLTRLHARYTRDTLGDDLVFREASPIRGGQGGGGNKLSTKALTASRSTFQGRYIIRHKWTGPVTCKDPKRGMWGGAPASVKRSTSPLAAQKLAFARRSGVNLTSMVVGGMPALASASTSARPAANTKPAKPAKPAATTQKPTRTKRKATRKREDKGPGCGCSAPGSEGTTSGLLLLLAVAFPLARRRRRTEPPRFDARKERP